MFRIKIPENIYVAFLLVFLLNCLIGYVDFVTGDELSFSIFYLIPLALFAMLNNTTIYAVIPASILASLVWFLAEFNSRTYSNILFPIWNTFVRLAIFIIISLLIINLKEKHKKLKQVNRNLKDLNEEKNKLIGIAAHDLRSPMSGIFSFSDLLIENYKETVPPKVTEILGIIRTMSKNTIMVLQNLLDVSKIESGKVEMNFQPYDYIAFIKDQITYQQILAKRKNINLHFECLMDTLVFKFDHNYLGEVVDNLISNAIKYSNSNSDVIIKVFQIDKKQIKTEIIDQGKGIAEEEQNKLFNYFQKTSTRPTGGEISTGLGLAIAKRIIISHQGTIGLTSVLDKGSTFYFTVPLKN